MNNIEIYEQFQKGVKYKRIGFIILLFAAVPLIIFENTMGYILTIILMGIGFYFERQYKCPACGKVFDARIRSEQLSYCPNCSKKLQEFERY